MPTTPSEKIDAEHGAERGARGGAQNIRRYQRIAKQALERGAGDRERGPDQDGGEHARPAHQQDHVLDRRPARRTRGRSSLRRQHLEQIAEARPDSGRP